MTAKIDKQKCASDNRICEPLTLCPEKVLVWIEDDEEPLGSRMEVIEEKCIGCGICILLCCENCIEVK